MSLWNINSVNISGRLTRDPEVKVTQSGNSITTFGIAQNRSKKVGDGEYQDYPCYYEVVVFQKLGEMASERLSKGQMIVVSGVLDFNEWTNEAGEKRSKHQIVANNILFPPRPENGEQAQQATQAPVANEPVNDGAIPDDDIPF